MKRPRILVMEPGFGVTTYIINDPDFDGKVAWIDGKRYVLQEDIGYFCLEQVEAVMTKLFQPRHRFRSDEEWEKANGPDPIEAAKIALHEKNEKTLRLKIQEGIKRNMNKAKEVTQ